MKYMHINTPLYSHFLIWFLAYFVAMTLINIFFHKKEPQYPVEWGHNVFISLCFGFAMACANWIPTILFLLLTFKSREIYYKVFPSSKNPQDKIDKEKVNDSNENNR
jgi:hypothetical protein